MSLRNLPLFRVRSVARALANRRCGVDSILFWSVQASTLVSIIAFGDCWLVRTVLQEVLEAEMAEALGAEKGERTAGRQGYRSGYYGRTLITRVGKLELLPIRF